VKRVFFALALSFCGTLIAQEATPTPEPQPQASPEATPIVLPIPIGHPATNIRIPDYDKLGKIVTLLAASEVVRLDDEQARMKGVRIELFDKEGETAFIINLPESMFDLKTRILTSKDPVRVQNENIELTGSSLNFNAEAKTVHLPGKVHMSIRDAGNIVIPDTP